MSQAKDDFLERSKEYWNPGKTADWQRFGVDLVIDPKSFDRERSKYSCRAYLASFFPAEFALFLDNAAGEQQRHTG